MEVFKVASLIGLVEMKVGGENFIIADLQSKTILQLIEAGEDEMALRLAKRTHIELEEGSCVSPPGSSGTAIATQRDARERKVVRPPPPSEFGPNVPASKESQDAQAIAQATRDEANAGETESKTAKTEVKRQEPGGLNLGDITEGLGENL